MTRKDYELIAAAFRKSRPARRDHDPERDVQWKVDVLNIAEKLRSDNSRFNTDRFVEACKK